MPLNNSIITVHVFFFGGARDAAEKGFDMVRKLVNEKLNEGEAIYGDRYLRITFEELFAADGAGLDKLTDWMGLARSKGMKEEAGKERVNASRGSELPAWEKWCGGDQAKVMRHCEGLMRVYGYVKEPTAVEVA